MCKRKRFRKVLNIFLCVLSIMVVFSMTVFAGDAVFRYHCGSFTIYDDGEFLYDSPSLEIKDGEMFYAVFTSSMLRVYFCRVNNDGNKVFDAYYEHALDPYLYVYDRNTGEKFYVEEGEQLCFDITNRSGTLNYVLDVIHEPISTTQIAKSMDMVFGVVADFSKIITENALLLLFAIGLPICSLGVGLLIHLRERT